jgi:hypothetical protein
VKRALVAAAVALLVAGCSGDDASTTQVRVYFLQNGKVWPMLRQIEATEDMTAALTAELAAGPTQQEQEDLKLSTEVPSNQDLVLSERGLAQLVYTRTQFPDVESVEIDGRSYSRADFENYTPAILVESPLPFEEVGSPLRVTGTANTFEANFSYELTDTDGLIVDENFVTATSGTGTRGTFDFTTKPYTVKFDGIGALIVFERSAKDGSRINLVEIPLRMTR